MFSDSYSVFLKTIDYLNLKLYVPLFSGHAHTTSFKIGISKVQDFGKDLGQS